VRGCASIVAIAVLLAGCGASKPAPAPDPSVFVTLQKPVQGSLPNLLTAYGSAAPSINGSQTLSVPQAGQVTRLATTPGGAVRAGQTVAIFTVDPAAVSTYQQAASALNAAQKQRATTEQLLGQQLATRDQLTQADKAVTDASAALAALQRTGGGRAVQVLRAPFDGIVTNIAVAQGDRTQAGAALVTIARTGGIVVTVGVDPASRPSLRVGQSATLERLSGGAALAGKVLRIDSALNPKTRQVDVDVGFPPGALLPGEALRVGIRIGDVAGWVVPHRAVVTANGDVRLYQVSNGKAVPVKVSLLLVTPGGDVVAGPVDPGRRLIVDGAYQVSDGASVRWAGR